jgi:adenosylhomocysteinase
VTTPHDVKDLGLAGAGRLRLDWAELSMPVLRQVRERFTREQPLRGVRVGACLHVTTETAVLMLTLQAGGAAVSLCASNPLSTQDDVAAALVRDHGIPVYAQKGEDHARYYQHIDAVLAARPQVTMDDGADLIGKLHGDRRDLLPDVLGGTEETTTGVIRLRAMEKDGVLAFPVVAVNDADTKHLFDNRYGTGQSTLDGVIRATNRLLAGRTVVVSGYGWCGRGIASRADGMGSNVIVLEVDPLRALEAHMDGYRVMPAVEAAKYCDIWITVTGDLNVIDEDSFAAMKDGAIICNSGHFNAEINIPRLREMAVSSRGVRPLVEEFTMADGRTICLLADGRLVNLSCAEGHPASVMDMSFATQALASEWAVKNQKKLAAKVYEVPSDVEQWVAKLKLGSMGIRIDSLSAEQQKYLSSWAHGT